VRVFLWSKISPQVLLSCAFLMASALLLAAAELMGFWITRPNKRAPCSTAIEP